MLASLQARHDIYPMHFAEKSKTEIAHCGSEPPQQKLKPNHAVKT